MKKIKQVKQLKYLGYLVTSDDPAGGIRISSLTIDLLSTSSLRDPNQLPHNLPPFNVQLQLEGSESVPSQFTSFQHPAGGIRIKFPHNRPPFNIQIEGSRPVPSQFTSFQDPARGIRISSLKIELLSTSILRDLNQFPHNLPPLNIQLEESESSSLTIDLLSTSSWRDQKQFPHNLSPFKIMLEGSE
ncbi:hypothetical protein PoB_003877000 [Plakobranchus ocellatus]|uniref:Uncharacterized protein n=1 Tax=Plakobranchus ocellatus TaxID=259542 RepID=A0AAV4AV91_9GAST|nr:hypothetical protein PoB_003877000 [Plakobranchus ocellatus]